MNETHYSTPNKNETSDMYSELEFCVSMDMSNTFEIDDYFTILKLVSSIKTNDKLRILMEDTLIENSPPKKKIEIDTRSFPQLTRWWTQDNRNDTIRFLEETFHSVLAYITVHMSTMQQPTENHGDFTNEQEKNNIQSLLYHLEQSIQGLYHLKTTYQDDFQIQSKLEILIQSIQFHIQKRKEQFVLQKR